MKQGVCRSLVISLLIFTALAAGVSSPAPQMMAAERSSHNTSYTPMTPFNVTSDTDFELLSFPGNGSASNPYVISGINITDDDSTLIWIRNTRAHFRIESCWFSSKYAGFSSAYSLLPVTIANSTNGLIIDNDFADSLAAISMYSCSNFQVLSNRFETYAQTVSIRKVNDSLFEGNDFGLDHVDFGAWLSLSYNCTVRLNTFHNVTTVGLEFSHCSSCLMEENTIYFVEEAVPTTEAPITLFRGENCTVKGVYGPCYRGIWAEGTEHSIIANTVTEPDYGIYARLESSRILSNNITDFRWSGIEMSRSNDTLVSANNLWASSKYGSTGIAIYGGHDSSVSHSNIAGTGYGIALQGCDSALVEKSEIRDSRYGIWFFREGVYENPDGVATNTQVYNNTLTGGGIHFYAEADWEGSFGNQTILDNTLNGREIGYFEDIEGLFMIGTGYGQLIFANCSYVSVDEGYFAGVKSDIEIYGYTDYGYASAISFLNCRNVIASSVTLCNNTMGIEILGCSGIQILDINASLNSWAGVATGHTGLLVVVDSFFSQNLKGLAIGWTWDCWVDSCDFTENSEGLVLATAPLSNVTGCSFTHNADGAFIGDSDETWITDSAFLLNERGLLLNSTSDCRIIGNRFWDTVFAGIVIDFQSSGNYVYDNDFRNNLPHVVCLGSSNHFDDQVSTGNSWDNYSGTGPYMIDEDDQDNFPRRPDSTSTGSQTGSNGAIDLFLIAISAGIVGVVALVLVAIERSDVTVVD
jgi:parallel beta-helix repeat protein